ncbi:uncharacterized protein LOC124910799 isoform X2 [Impatiens glandulifera]|uniref:uncharacterized protein LOC124910799 isoform X2 n=1 Tax=Impatiens glandulifera TaxID=253017 RepID=UPI001FB14BB4|nr:uncharacterized protein LOC124910799 isoform X2 [Impatiens glandulifera]
MTVSGSTLHQLLKNSSNSGNLANQRTELGSQQTTTTMAVESQELIVTPSCDFNNSGYSLKGVLNDSTDSDIEAKKCDTELKDVEMNLEGSTDIETEKCDTELNDVEMNTELKDAEMNLEEFTDSNIEAKKCDTELKDVEMSTELKDVIMNLEEFTDSDIEAKMRDTELKDVEMNTELKDAKMNLEEFTDSDIEAMKCDMYFINQDIPQVTELPSNDEVTVPSNDEATGTIARASNPSNDEVTVIVRDPLQKKVSPSYKPWMKPFMELKVREGEVVNVDPACDEIVVYPRCPNLTLPKDGKVLLENDKWVMVEVTKKK